MKLKTFIIMGFISTSCLGGCAQRPDPLVKRQSNSTISISLPHYGHFSRPLYKHRVGENWYRIPTPSTEDGEDGYLYQKRNLHRLL